MPAVVLWLILFGLPFVGAAAILFGIVGGLLGSPGVIVWRAFFSRVPWPERWAPM